MDAQEFRNDFMQTAKADGLAIGDGTCAAFVINFAKYLEEAEMLPDFTPAFFEGTGRRGRKIRVDGYLYDDVDQSMTLIIADFVGYSSDRVITKTQAEQCKERLQHFAEDAVEGHLKDKVEESMPHADLVDDLIRLNQNGDIAKYRFLIFTDAQMSTALKELDTCHVAGVPADTQVWDLDRLFRVCGSDTGRASIEIDFSQYVLGGIPCLQTSEASSEDFKSYLCVIPGKVLADIYDKYGSVLLEGNVRSFLSTKVAVNKKIRETILRIPERFFAYNNGISVTARDVKTIRTPLGMFIVAARDFQIINGGQTTASLSNARFRDKADLSSIYVQMKLTEIEGKSDDEAAELVQNISRSSNSQNKVSDADFFSTHPFHVQMEQISRRLFAPAVGGQQHNTKWFYERARGQYLQEQMKMTAAEKKKFQAQNPKDHLMTKTDFAKVRNSWDMHPHIVSKGAQTNFMKFADAISAAWEKDNTVFNERYYQETVALMILFKTTEALVSRQDWYEGGYRANVVTYSIAMLRQLIKRYYKDRDLNLMNIWTQQSVPNGIVDVLTSITKQVYMCITDDKRLVANVTQWCKREACWDAMRKIDMGLSTKIESYLVTKEDMRVAKADAAKDQKVVSDMEYQQKVDSMKDIWAKLDDFITEKQMPIRADEKTALKATYRMNIKLPEPFQCKMLLAMLDRAEAEGFKK